MFGTGGATVARGGRPKKENGKVSTKHVRVNDDLAEMLSMIVKAMNNTKTTAQILDPIIRGPIIGLYDKYRATIKLLKQAERSAEKEQEEEE